MVGTMHAWHAVQRGHEVVHLEREAEARGASVRNFGLVWVGGRAGGAELDTALRARELWEEIGAAVPGLGFRGNGSLTLVTNEAELAVARAAAEGPRPPGAASNSSAPQRSAPSNPPCAAHSSARCAADATPPSNHAPPSAS